jgi:hypothetical protein
MTPSIEPTNNATSHPVRIMIRLLPVAGDHLRLCDAPRSGQAEFAPDYFVSL